MGAPLDLFQGRTSLADHVFLVHGRSLRERDAFAHLLRSIGLKPIEWEQAAAWTGVATPYVGEVLAAGFAHARAVVVLLTGDDEARLREPHWRTDDEPFEREYSPQPRPNVLFEAGYAMASHPDRTLLIQIGPLRPFSDAGGRHVIRFQDTPDCRRLIARRLETAGCRVDLSGTDWLTAGAFGL